MPKKTKSPENQVKNIVFYHHPCIDGSTSAWAAFQALGADNTKYIGLNHDQDEFLQENFDVYVSEKSQVYFCDIIPPLPALKKLLTQGCRVSIYDHHISAKKRLENFTNPNCEIVFDMNRSGAGLSWDIFNKGKTRPFLVNLVEAMDLFQLDFLPSREAFFTLAAGIDTLDIRDFSVFEKRFSELCASNDDGLKTVQGLGERQRQIYLERISTALDKMSYVSCSGIKALEGHKIGFIWEDISHLSREFWHKFSKACPYNPKILMACRYDHERKMVSVSFRGDGEADVSCAAEEIAAKYGINGGGHKNASAVRFTHEQFDVLIEKWQLPTV